MVQKSIGVTVSDLLLVSNFGETATMLWGGRKVRRGGCCREEGADLGGTGRRDRRRIYTIRRYVPVPVLMPHDSAQREHAGVD